MGIKKLLVIPVFALFSAMFGGIGSAYASFSVQTSSVTTNTQIYFTLAATGTFSINCGTGGRLMKGSSYLGSNGATVTVTQNDTNATSYSCKYSSSGIKTITFNGTATAYNADSTVACIRFTQNQDKIATVSGNMASVFPVVTVNNNPISPSFANTFAGCSLKQIPSGLFDFGQNGAPARENMFRGTFQSTTLTPPNNGSPIPADLFYTIQGSKPGMFRATFYNCQSLTFVPDGLFDFDGNTVYGYDYMFYETFSGCTSLTTFPDDLFANVEPDPSAQYVFSKTFYGCTSLTGNHNYIPSEMFGSFIPNDGYASSIMDGTFDNTGTFANSCPNDMEQFITGYESYWGSNKKSCGAPHSVYFHPGDSLNSGNGTVPSGSMSSYDDVPLNSNIELPTPSFNTQYMQGYDFVGWLCKDGAAMNGIYQPGDWITMQNADVSCTAQWAPFHMVTTNLSNNDTFTFTLSAAGEFWVNCGEDGVLSGVGVSGNTITKSDTTNYTYTCTYTSGGKKYLDFNGIATKYDNQGIYDNNTGEYLPVTTIKFTSPSKVSGLDGNLAKIFPPVYQDLNGMNDYGYLYPKFYQTFKDCVNLSSIPTYYDNNDNMYHGTLFSYDESIGDIYGNEHKVADFMFRETFKGCTSLQVIPDDLFPTVVTDGAGAMFKGTFSGCTNLETIPDGLFKFGGDALVPGIPELFRETFSGCTSLETIPDLLFDFGDDGYGNPLYMTVGQEMFSETFAGCTSLEVFPNDLFANFVDPNGNLRYPNNAFYRTFYGCTNLTGKLGYIPPEMFGALVPNPGYDPSTMMDTFADTGTFALTCPSGTTQYITGYESTWGTDKKSCNPAGVIFYAGDSNNDGTGTPATGSMNNINATYGDTVILPANQFQPMNGRFFSDWYCTGENVTIGHMSPGDTFTMPNGSVTCTAQWDVPRVQFRPGYSNNNGTGTPATGSMNDIIAASGTTVTLPANQFTAPNGYVFAEWVCDNNIGNVSPGDTFTQPNAVVICTAQWERTRVVFAPGDTNNNGTGTLATGSMNDIIAASGTTVTLPANQFTSNVTGYEFNGWVCDNNIGQKSSGDTFTMPSAIVICTAQWTNVFSITYFDDDCNTVLSGLSPTQYEYGLNGAPLLPLPTPSRPGYDFVGWRTNCQGASNTAISELSNTDSGNRVLFATFSVRQIPLSFDGNTVSGSASCTYGQTFNVPSVPASRTGYVFTGWKVKPCFELFNDQKVQDPAIDWSSGDWYEYGSDGNSWYVRYNVINNDVNYNNGDGFQTFLYGTHVCTTESGVPQYISGYNVGNYPDDIVCLCGVKKYENDFGIATREIHCDLPTPPRWVKNYSISGTNAYNHCVQECPKDCARDFKDSSTFRNNLLGN